MKKWKNFQFNKPYKGEEIIKVNEVVLPQDYIDFMKKHDGGEGDIGNSWLVLYSLGELQEINDDYEIEKYIPNHIIIGSDGAGELYGINKDGNYFNVPSIIDKKHVKLLGNDIELIIDEINFLWE